MEVEGCEWELVKWWKKIIWNSDSLKTNKYECDIFFFFNDTATTEIYTLSLHDALPIYGDGFFTTDRVTLGMRRLSIIDVAGSDQPLYNEDRSEEHTSELQSQFRISYAVFCLKKKTLYCSFSIG